MELHQAESFATAAPSISRRHVAGIEACALLYATTATAVAGLWWSRLSNQPDLASRLVDACQVSYQPQLKFTSRF